MPSEISGSSANVQRKTGYYEAKTASWYDTGVGPGGTKLWVVLAAAGLLILAVSKAAK